MLDCACVDSLGLRTRPFIYFVAVVVHDCGHGSVILLLISCIDGVGMRVLQFVCCLYASMRMFELLLYVSIVYVYERKYTKRFRISDLMSTCLY
jgi:hypothetical protein